MLYKNQCFDINYNRIPVKFRAWKSLGLSNADI